MEHKSPVEGVLNAARKNAEESLKHHPVTKALKRRKETMKPGKIIKTTLMKSELFVAEDGHLSTRFVDFNPFLDFHSHLLELQSYGEDPPLEDIIESLESYMKKFDA